MYQTYRTPRGRGIFQRTRRGQGIVEYGAVLSFVALLIAVVFGTAQGSLANALSQSFSSISGALTTLNRASLNP